MLLLLMLQQFSAGNWLLAHITQGNVPPAVNLMRSEVGLRDVMLAREVDMM